MVSLSSRGQGYEGVKLDEPSTIPPSSVAYVTRPPPQSVTPSAVPPPHHHPVRSPDHRPGATTRLTGVSTPPARPNPPSRVYVARLAGTAVFDPLGDQVGRVHDVVVLIRLKGPPRAVGLVVEVSTKRRVFLAANVYINLPVSLSVSFIFADCH